MKQKKKREYFLFFSISCAFLFLSLLSVAWPILFIDCIHVYGYRLIYVALNNLKIIFKKKNKTQPQLTSKTCKILHMDWHR